MKNLNKNESIELSVSQREMAAINNSDRTAAIASGKNLIKLVQSAVRKGRDITVLPRISSETYHPYFCIKVWGRDGLKEGLLYANNETEQFITALIKGEENLPKDLDFVERRVLDKSSNWLDGIQTMTAANAVRISKQMDILDDDTVYTYYVHKCKLCKVQYPSVKSTIDDIL